MSLAQRSDSGPASTRCDPLMMSHILPRMLQRAPQEAAKSFVRRHCDSGMCRGINRLRVSSQASTLALTVCRNALVSLSLHQNGRLVIQRFSIVAILTR